MAYENGHNIYNYCSEIFKKYLNDNMIFVKALQIVQYFETRSDAAFCVEELDKAIEKILGSTMTRMAHHEANFINYGSETDKIEWDPYNVTIEERKVDILEGIENTEKVTNSFRNDLESFCLTLKPVFDRISQYQDDPMQLKKVTYRTNIGRFRSVIRFIRNDDKYFDIIVSEMDTGFLVKTLRELPGGDCHEFE